MSLRLLLASHRQQILDRFVHRVREAQLGEHPEALPRIVLLDGLPAFLDRVADALARLEDPGSLLGSSSTSVPAMEHGIQRNELGFELPELVREYGMLYDVILEVAQATESTFELAELRLLARHLTAGAAEASEHFVRARERERAQLEAKHFGFLAHELRNKLSAAVATMSWWRRSQTAAELAVRTLDESLSDLTSLVDSELIAGRIENLRNGLELRREGIAAAELIFAVLKDVRPLAEARGVSVGTSAAPGLALEVDPRLIRAALGNLLSNAVKLTPQGGRVEVRATSADSEVTFEVEDEAGGLPEGLAERLFTPFAQGGQDRSGHGLGLAIAREAVALHGGRITAESTPGKGSRFRITLPVR